MGLNAKRGHWRWDRAQQKFVAFTQEVKEVVAPRIVTDEMPATISPADGKIYTSRAKMRRAAIEAGFRPTDGERNVASKRPERSEKEYQEAVEEAYHLVKNGMAPLTEKDKAHCEAMNKRLADADRGNS